MQVNRDVRVVCMSMGIVHEALLKASMLNGEQEKKKRNKRSGRTTLSISQEICRPLYPRLLGFPEVGTKNDG